MAIRAQFIDVLVPAGATDAAWRDAIGQAPADLPAPSIDLGEALFWDTDDARLRAIDVAVCTARIAGRTRQALRAASVASSRIFASDVVGDRPSFDAARADGWRGAERLPAVAALRPRFRVHAHGRPIDDRVRRLATFAHIVVASVGGVPSRRRALDVLRIDVPLHEPARAWRLARRVCDRLPGARLWFADEVDVGYALSGGPERPPSRAVARAPDADGVARAAVGVAFAMLRCLCGNVDGARGGGDPEYVHQMRLALRRFRAAARVAAALGMPLVDTRAKRSIRRFARILGGTRDWDVVATSTWRKVAQRSGDGPVPARIAAAIARRRNEHHRALRDVLASAEIDALVLDLGEGVARATHAKPRRDVARRDDRRRAARLCAKLARRLACDDAMVGRLEVSALHQLRINAKKLRYVAEIVALSGSPEVERYVRRLTGVQSALGALNDIDVGVRRLDDLALPARDVDAARAMWRRHAEAEAALLRSRFVTAWRRYRRTKAFWSR